MGAILPAVTLVLREADVERVIQMDAVIAAVEASMRELGAASDVCHDDISRQALESGADIVAGIGEFATSLRRVAPDDARVLTAATVDEVWPLLAPRLAPDAVILLKASRGVQLERLVPHLTTWSTQ